MGGIYTNMLVRKKIKENVEVKNMMAKTRL